MLEQKLLRRYLVLRRETMEIERIEGTLHMVGTVTPRYAVDGGDITTIVDQMIARAGIEGRVVALIGPGFIAITKETGPEERANLGVELHEDEERTETQGDQPSFLDLDFDAGVGVRCIPLARGEAYVVTARAPVSERDP